MSATSVSPVRFVVVDDEPDIRALVRASARRSPMLELVGEASDGDEAVALIAGVQPEAVLLDVYMPVNGLSVMPLIRQVAPGTCVLVWSARMDAVRDALEAGADDALDKTLPWEEISSRLVGLARRTQETEKCEPADVGGDELPGSPLSRAFVLRPETVEVMAASRFEAPVAETAMWPCPGCSSRRLLHGAWSLRVANKHGEAFERDVLVCALCAEALEAHAHAH